MATRSTIVAVKQQLVTLLTAELDPVPVDYAWPGPSTAPLHVFLGRHPALADIRIDASHDIATVTTARKNRDERYVVPVTVWSFRPDLDPTDAETAEIEGFATADAVEDVVADDATLGGVDGVLAASVSAVDATLFPFESGWASEVVVQVEVRARLQ